MIMIGKKIIVNIDGMSCSHCAKRVEDALKEIDNVKSVKVNLDKKNATITYKNDIDIDIVKDKIDELDFKFIGYEKH